MNIKAKNVIYATIILAVFLKYPSVAKAEMNIGILFDISGSMKLPGVMEDGRKQLIELLSKGQIDQIKWRLESYKTTDRLLENIGQNRPLISEKCNIYLVHVKTAEDQSPYFTDIYPFAGKEPDEAFSLLNSHFPDTPPPGTPFSPILLAQAVASEYFKKQGAKEWYLFTYSDFIKDYSKLTEEQNDLCLNFEAEKEINQTILFNVILKRNNKVRIRVDKISVAQEPSSTDEIVPVPTPENEAIKLLGPQNRAKLKVKKPTFIWQWTGNQEIEEYKLILNKKDGKKSKIVFVSSLKRTTFKSPKDLDPGEYAWYIKAKYSKGSTTSATRIFEIPSNSFIWIIIILLIAGAAFLFFKFAWPLIQSKRIRRYR